MSSNRRIGASEFRRQVIGEVRGLAISAAPVVIVGWIGLLDIGEAEWKWLLGLVAGGGAVVGGLAWMWLRRLLEPVCVHLERRSEGLTAPDPTGENPPRLAFAAIQKLPGGSAWVGSIAWTGLAAAIATAMRLRFSEWGGFDAAVVTLSGVCAGLVVGCFVYLGVRRVVESVGEVLASEFADPAERNALNRHLPLRRKLLAGAMGVVAIPLVCGLLFAESRATRSVEDLTLHWQRLAMTGAEAQRALADDGANGVTSDAGLPIAISLLELTPGEVGQSHVAPKLLEHLRLEIARGVGEGSTTRLDSRMILSWRRIDDRRVLVAATPRSELPSSGYWEVFAGLLVVSVAVAVGLAIVFSSAMGRATRALRRVAERMASGESVPARAYESEDELGELARLFDRMGSTLRADFAQIATAAERVESMVDEIEGLAGNVVAVTADQSRGIEQSATSIEGINDRAKVMANSSSQLTVVVEEAHHSVSELGSAEQQLGETARVLSTQVAGVSSSIEQMILSVREVSENASSLGDTSAQMSASMAEMATSLHEVDTSAEESVRLSRQVVNGAEKGQEKVRQTIAGMEAIRDATETAERVIRNLGIRTNEIGAIVEVIDDVADETNLLALNAAIIAAQAGENGRAFAVVADQIKDLADRVLVSTKEIGALIRGLQSESSNAIGAVERGGESVASGVDLSAEAGVSLEEITLASRESGTRMARIVTVVSEQARAAGHVVELMERVKAGVEGIRHVSGDQERDNETAFRGAIAMREAADRLSGNAAHGSARIKESVDRVREHAGCVQAAFQGQSLACETAVEFLGDLRKRTRSNEELSQQMEGAVRELFRKAVDLRKDIGRVRIASGDGGSR